MKLFEESKVESFGFENQPTNFTNQFIPYLERNLNDLSFDWEYMDSIANLVCRFNDTIPYEDLENLKLELEKVKKVLTETDEGEIQSLSIDNFNSHIDQKLLGSFYDYEAQNLGVNIRDKRMADNIIWYLNKNPDKKIIIWAANFHIAKDISEVIYGRNDSLLYERYHLMGEYLFEEYDDQLFSLAFTSSEGVTGNCFSDKSYDVVTYDGTFEFKLQEKNKEIGFVDFNSVKDKSKQFYASMLNLKLGRWYNVYDGVFYIRNQEKSIKKK